jgi:peroxiredoxin
VIAQQDPYGRQRLAGRQRVPLQAGQLAPDFELARLDPFMETNGVSSARTVESLRLSALRGKRPVVLIFSSFS